MPKIAIERCEPTNRTGYPAPYDAPVKGRWNRRLGPPSGLTDMTMSHVTLEPGAWSSQRHVHELDDELLVMLSGEAMLIEDEGRTMLRTGDIVAFPKAGTAHHLVNEGAAPWTFLAISPYPERGDVRYPDIDLFLDGKNDRYCHSDRTPYQDAGSTS